MNWIKIWYVYTHTHTHTHTQENYSVIKKGKKNQNNAIATTWMKLEIIISSEVNQKEKYIYHITLCGI